MTPILGAAMILALVLAAALIGLLLRRRGARVRDVRGAEAIDPFELGAAGLGSAGTIVQFSTEFCSRCPGVRRTLTSLAGARDGVSFIHVDVTDRADLAKKFHLLQTPTVLFVGPDGTPTTRLSGSLTRGDLEGALDSLTGGSP